MDDWPVGLTINAYAGAEATPSAPALDAESWLLRSGPPRLRTFLKPEPLPDPANWRDPRVGWGLLLAHDPALSPAAAAAAEDAPEPLRTLVAERGVNGSPAPVFRYIPGPSRAGFLHRNGADIPVSQAPKGTGPGAIPRYMLIYGTPDRIPWEVQYLLNSVCAVGRLTLIGSALENYVTALRNNWQGAAAKPDAAVIWAVDHGGNDITSLMRQSIAKPLFEKVHADPQMSGNSVFVDGTIPGAATVAGLIQALAARTPGLIVTTSHGQTGPLGDIQQLTANLGLLVDEHHQLLRPDDLLNAWQPSGAIWYAHACCSAGSDAQTLFDGLIQKDSLVDQVLKGVAKAGARVAPLPEKLLGASAPLRAFVGHVEPTFDWTLRQPQTGQFLTEPIQEALYSRLFQPQPIGLALRDLYDRLGAIFGAYDIQLRQFNKGVPKSEARMLYHLLVARDVQSMVMLGDPTAMLPSL